MRRVRSLRRRLFIKALRKRNLALFLNDCKRKGLLSLYCSEFIGLEDAQQDPFYHPEGSAWIHTLRCVEIAENQGYGFSIVLASLLHAVGKAVLKGNLAYHSHEKESAKIARRFFFRFPLIRGVVRKVISLVINHMKFHHPLSEKTVRKMVKRYPYLDDLILLTEIDLKGSCGISEIFLENKRKILSVKKKLREEEKKPLPLLNGNEIMKILGISPGKRVGELKSLVYQAQLKGYIATKEEAIRFLKEITDWTLKT